MEADVPQKSSLYGKLNKLLPKTLHVVEFFINALVF